MLVIYRRVLISVLFLVLEISDFVYWGYCNVSIGGEKNYIICRKEKVGGEILF